MFQSHTTLFIILSDLTIMKIGSKEMYISNGWEFPICNINELLKYFFGNIPLCWLESYDM